jgi:acetolactate synthase I/II/III large subunit
VARVQGGVVAAHAIRAHGVDTIFTVSSGHLMPIYQGCRLEGVRVIDTRHGQAAAHAAEAWGRINRACGVAVVAAGTGSTGAMTAVANSFVAQTPLVVVGAAPELHQQSLFRPVTKWSSVCTDADRIPEYVATAFRHALAQPRGPVYLELPMDVLLAEADDVQAQPSRSTARTFGDPREVMKAAEVLNGAERPVVIAGSGVWWDGAWKQLAFFTENGRLPSFLEASGRGALPPGHDLLFEHARDAALAAADVVCVIGTPLDFRLRRDAKLVHIHADATELGRNHAPDAGIVGDCAAVLGILADGVKNVRVDREPWLERVRNAERACWDEHRAEMESDSSPIRAYRLAKALDHVLDPGTIVIGDGGDIVAAVSRVLRVHRPGHCSIRARSVAVGSGRRMHSASRPRSPRSRSSSSRATAHSASVSSTRRSFTSDCRRSS